MHAYGSPPEWLMGPASAVVKDLQGAMPISGLQLVASAMDEGFNGPTVTLLEPSRTVDDLPQLPDELDPATPSAYGGGDWVPRTMAGPELLVHVAELLQVDLVESEIAWGQARPPCPHHSHPAQPILRDGQAWWLCPRNDELLYRIGNTKVPARMCPPPSWRPTERRPARQ